MREFASVHTARTYLGALDRLNGNRSLQSPSLQTVDDVHPMNLINEHCLLWMPVSCQYVPINLLLLVQWSLQIYIGVHRFHCEASQERIFLNTGRLGFCFFKKGGIIFVLLPAGYSNNDLLLESTPDSTPGKAHLIPDPHQCLPFRCLSYYF